jgi:hypothetical protein
MTGWQALLWALLGSAIAEALNVSASMRPTGPRGRWRWPWRSDSDRPMVVVAILLRLFVGSGVAAALGASGQLPTPFTALLAGVVAPLIVAKTFAAIPTSGLTGAASPHSDHSLAGSRKKQMKSGDSLATVTNEVHGDVAGADGMLDAAS